MDKETAKTIVRIISVLYFIGCFFAVIFAIACFTTGELLLLGTKFLANESNLSNKEKIEKGIKEITFIMMVIGGVFLILGVISLFVGIGLWKFNNTARIVAIIFSILGILIPLLFLFLGFKWLILTIVGEIISLIIDIPIFILLTFQRDIVDLFKK